MEVSDLVKTNLIKMIKMELTVSLPFLVKSVYGKDHIQYYKYSINQKIQYWSTPTNEFYFFPTNEIKDMILVYFPAKEFLSIEDAHEQYLSMYLKKHLS